MGVYLASRGIVYENYLGLSSVKGIEHGVYDLGLYSDKGKWRQIESHYLFEVYE